MATLFSDIVQFADDLLDHYVAFGTGSLPVLVLAFWERWKGRTVSFRLFVVVFLAFGLLAASFETWRFEVVARTNAEKALSSAAKRDTTVIALKAFYAEADVLFRESLAVKTPDELKKYDAKADDFSRRLEKWVTENMGAAANARLMRYSMPPNLTFRTAIGQDHSSSIVAIMPMKENIAAIIENSAWDGPLAAIKL
jgi:hypothetical protein